VRSTAKAAGLTEPTADEKDPAFLALQVKALRTSVQQLIDTQGLNLRSISEAFQMVDLHQQVLTRVARHVTAAVVRVRRLQVDGDVDMHTSDFAELKLLEEGGLDMEGYYRERTQVIELAGSQDLADLAVSFWAKGLSVEDSIRRAKLSTRNEQSVPDSEEEYEDQFFGGTSGQDNHQQVPPSASEGG
jgi:hypothetical protein